MSDCANVAMREMLPEYLHDRLDAATRAAVDAHLIACADCAAELETLRSVRSAFDGVRRPDVASIVAALPKPAAARRARPVRRLIPWQMAAALAVATVGGLSFMVGRHFAEQPAIAVAPDSAPTSSGAAPDAVVPQLPTPAPAPVVRPRVRETASTADVEPHGGLSVAAGGIDDLDTAQLEALIRSLDQLEAAPAADPGRSARLSPVRSELQ